MVLVINSHHYMHFEFDMQERVGGKKRERVDFD